MGGRGQTSSTTKQKQGGGQTAGGGVGSSSSKLTSNQKRGNDDFSRRGVGDKMGVVGQGKRGRKSKGNEFYKKGNRRKR